MSRLLLLALMMPISTWAFDHSHKDWTAVLVKYQNPQGLINYKELKSDIQDAKHSFVRYLSSIQSVTDSDYQKWSPDQKKAYLINSYNALTVKLIVDNYPVKSIKKIGGLFTKPWSIEFFSLLDGKIKSLDPIEHEYLRPVFKDYRIHAAVNCASYSCPPLRHEAFVAAKLDQQLDDQMRAWLADPARNVVDLNSKTLQVSKIFDWYKKDFETWGGGVVNVINKYLQSPMPRQIASEVKVKFLDYNWDLNEAK